MSDARRKTWTIVGIVIAVAGVAAGVLLWVAASQRYDHAIDALAPAPVGCDTTLEFDRTGTFFIFAETKGSVEDLDGDCANDEQDYEGSGDNLDIVMFDDNSNEIDLERASELSYDNGSSEGQVLYSVQIEEEGDYTLRVQGDDDGVVARVGPDPNDSVALLRITAVAALVVGLMLGLLFILLARRRPTGTDEDRQTERSWGGESGTPPGAPPYRPSTVPMHQPVPGWDSPGGSAPPPSAPSQPPLAPPAQPWRPPSG